MNDRVSLRQPVQDWRWWVLLVVLTAIAFVGGSALFQAGLDSGTSGAVASLPLVAFVFLTYFWRKRALSTK